MQDLNSLLDSTGANLYVEHAYGINDHGVIAATVVEDVQTSAALLTPYYKDDPSANAITAGRYQSGSLASLANIDQN